MTAATATTVQYLNLAYFGRPADPASLTAFPATGMTDEQIVASFVKTSEYATNTLTPNSSTNPGGGSTVNQTNLINTFYQRLFGRLAAAVEITGWTTALAQGTVNEDYLGITIMRAGLNLPADTEMRKVLVAKFDSAQAFSNSLAASPSDAQAYSTSAAITSASNFLAGVTTSTAATSAEVSAAVTAMVGSSAALGSTFELTTNVDTFTGTAQNDTFSANVSGTTETLGILDDLNGGAGTDTLNYTTVGGSALTGKLTSIETVNIVSDGAITASTNTTQVTGVTTITGRSTGASDVDVDTNGDVTSVTLSGTQLKSINIDDNATTDVISSVSITGVTDDGGNATDDIDINSTALTSLTLSDITLVDNGDDISTDTTGALSLSLNAVSIGAGDILAATATSAAVTTSGTTAIVVDDLDFSAATTVTFAAGETSTTGTTIDGLDIAAAEKLTITGAGKLTLTNGTYTALTEVDATANTGGVKMTAALAAADAFKGGSGADTITLGAASVASTLGAGDDSLTISSAFADGGSVDGGAGTDTISITAANAVLRTANTNLNADISNFEKASIGAYADLDSGAGNTINMTNFDSINYVVSAGSATQTQAEALAISGFSEGGTFEQTAALGANANVTLTGSFTGASDSFNLAVSATNGFANSGALTLAAVETLSIALDDTDTTAATTMVDLNLDAVHAQTVTVTGDIGITFANSSYTSLRTLDASGITSTGAAGVVTFTANDGADTIITTAGGNDVITGGTGNDTIVAGAGADTINGKVGIDTITTGAGADSVVIDGALTTDIVTDFTAGTGGDQIDLDESALGAIIGGDGADDADTVAVGLKEVSGATTAGAANNVFVITGAKYASNTEMEAAIISGGDRAITLASAATKNDDLIVVWTTTAGNTIVSTVDYGAAATTFASSAVVSDLVQLTGVDSSVSGTLVAANFDLV